MGHVPTQWFEVTIEAPPSHAEAIANFLLESGAPGVESQERGDGVALIAYFHSPPPLDALERYCADIAGAASSEILTSVRQTSDQDWANEWKQHTRPQPLGERLYVCPSWETTAPADRVVLIIDPGMAFGTGQHPTTRGCLELADRATRHRRVRRGLDFGTGSGILGIALAKLGVPEVWAMDNDPVARAVAAQNAALNGVANQIHIGESMGAAPAHFDLIVANLYADLLQELAPRLVATLELDGLLIASGFLVADEARVCAAYEARGLALQERREEESWVTAGLMRRRGTG